MSISLDGNKDRLDIHMESFDNLGFNNEKVYNWRKSILRALEEDGIIMSDFYYTPFHSNNKQLLQHIASRSETYNFLSNEGLLNTGYCPITGEKIDNTLNYNIFNRKVYLSKRGVDVCKAIEGAGYNDNQYEEFTKSLQKSKQKANIIIEILYIVITVLSIFISWKIVSPSGFFSFIGFILLAIVLYHVIGWLLNFLFDIIYR